MASSKDLVVIVAAAGHQCGYLVPLLYKKVPLRLIVNSDKSRKLLTSKYPDAEIVQADLVLPPDCARVLDGATTVYHIGPSLHPGEKAMGLNMVSAALVESQKPGSKFRHFVMASVLNTQIRKMFNHDDKRYIEEALILSGLDYTILQPGDFLEIAVPAKSWLQQEKPVRHAVTAQQARSSFIALKDLGEAAAKVILERGKHYQALYPLVSVGPITYGEATRQIGEIIGKKIEIQEYTIEEASGWLLDLIFGDRKNADPIARDKMESLVLFYSRRGIQGNPNVLEWLLERKPTSLAEYVKLEQQAISEGR